MARGTNSGESNLQLFFMKIVGCKEGELVTIKQTQAVEKGKHIELDETVQDVSGQLHKVEVREYEPKKGEKAHELKVWLKDGKAGEMYAVSCNMNSVGRNIINMLLNATAPFGVIMINVYNNKRGYASVSMTHNGEKLSWKYNPKEDFDPYITKNTVVKNGVTRIENDYWALNLWLKQQLEEHVAPHLTKVPTQFQDNRGELQSDIAPIDNLMPDDVSDGTDDLPF